MLPWPGRALCALRALGPSCVDSIEDPDTLLPDDPDTLPPIEGQDTLLPIDSPVGASISRPTTPPSVNARKFVAWNPPWVHSPCHGGTMVTPTSDAHVLEPPVVVSPPSPTQVPLPCALGPRHTTTPFQRLINDLAGAYQNDDGNRTVVVGEARPPQSTGWKVTPFQKFMNGMVGAFEDVDDDETQYPTIAAVEARGLDPPPELRRYWSGPWYAGSSPHKQDL